MTRQERKCDSGEVENVDHWLMRCDAWKIQCVQLEAWMQRHSDKCSTQDSTGSPLSAECDIYGLLSIILCTWHARFSPYILHVHIIHFSFVVGAAWGQLMPGANGHGALY